MIDLVYTDRDGIEQGAVSAYSLDLAYGDDENDFALTLPIEMQIENRSFVYLDDTEWGGIVRGGQESTLNDKPVYVAKGMTWHGMLASTYIVPKQGEDYVKVSGEANASIGAIIERIGLSSVFDTSKDGSGINVNHQFDRFTDCYSGLRKMLRASGAKLKIMKNPGSKPTLYAAPIGSYIDSEEAARYGYKIEWGTPVNHLICLGKGDLSERTVMHLYADSNGNVSDTQSLFGLDEVQEVYDYNNIEDDELLEEGTKKLKELQNVQSSELSLPEDATFDVDDVVGVIAESSGVSVTASVSKVIVKIGENGIPLVSNEIGKISSSRSSGGFGGSSAGGVTYSAGKGISIAGGVISAEVTGRDLEAKANAVHSHTWAEVVDKPATFAPAAHSHAWDGITGKPASYPPSAHTHDDRYYTESEMDAKLSSKSDTSHNHDAAYAAKAHTHQWGDVAGKPTSFAPSAHTHAWEDVTGKPTTFAPSAHGHAAADITSGTLPLARGGTGGSSAQTACDSLMTASMGAKRVIPVNADLNAYKTPGSYTCNADVNAKTLANCPTGGISFHLIVDQVLGNATYLSQTIRQYNANIVWMRISTNAGSSWGAWQRAWTIAPDAATARANIGAAASSHTHNYAGSSTAGGTATKAAALTDAASGSLITAQYSGSGVSTASWLACWTGYKIDAISPANVLKLIGAAASSHSHNAATASAAGFMSATDKQLMDTLRTGTVAGVKGNSESTYRTGNVNLTAANVGALPTAGGTLDAAAQIKRVGSSMSWMNGRDGALFRQTSYTGYNPVWSAKTTNGSWEMGPYTNNNLYFNYITDANYNAGTNSPTAQIVFGPNGSISAPGLIVAGKTLLDRTFPVGAVYISYVSTSPASLFGGTWTAITGRFPYFNAGTGTGGANTHTLTVAQMPSHNHGSSNGHPLIASRPDYVKPCMANGSAYWYAQQVNLTSTGGSGSHNNMPAYQTLYAWRRTA